MRAVWLIAALALAAGCKTENPPADGLDWSKLPTFKASATESGHAFTIELIEGEDEGKPFKPETLATGPIGKTAEYMIGDIAVEFTILVNAQHETLDQFVAGETTKTWLRKEALQPDGFVVSFENIYKDDYLVQVQRPELICSARITRWKSASSTSVVDKVPFVEKMCLSMTVVK